MRQLFIIMMAIALVLVGCQIGKFQEDEVVQPERINLASPAGSQRGQPNLHVSPEGHLYLSWIESVNDSTNKLCYSVWEDEAWSEPATIIEGNDWFVNWADFPSLIATNDLMAAHWLTKSGEGTYDYDIKVALSNDKGNTWHAPFILHQDGVRAEHGFATLVPLPQNRIFAVWLDGRGSKSTHPQHGEGAMRLQTTILDETGPVQHEITLDERVCDCCQTDAVMTDNGLVVVYRNRSKEEVRDIYIVRELKDGWSEPTPVHYDNWKITGCPVNGPAVAASGNTVAVAWFNAVHEEQPEVQVAFSEDGGTRFDGPVRVDSGRPLGRVDIVMLDRKSALVSWLEATNGGAAIQIMQVDVRGKKGPPQTIASTMASRASGFPVMEIANNYVYFAWTRVDSIASIQAARIPLEQLSLEEDI